MISFIKGDTFAFKFKINRKDKNVIQKEDIETLFITVRKYPNEESPILFQKTLEDIEIDNEGYGHAVFKPEDTENLIYGSYFFDREITLKNGYRKTKLDKFEITKETTTHKGGVVNGN